MQRCAMGFWVMGVLCATALYADERSDRVDALFEEYTQPGSPGLAITVMQGKDIVYEQGYGLAQLEYDIPITTETIFHVASVSKQFTTFAVLLLEQAGKLSLDDDIRKYLPEFPDLGHTITVRHLIHHTSGVRDQWSLLVAAGWRMDDVITRGDIMKLLNNQRELNFAPGDAHLYSNAGFTLLGEIVASISGQSLREFTTERIFEPLGMTRTHFHDDHRHIVPQRAYSYGKLTEGGFQKLVLSFANVGATSLFTTGADLMKWQRNLVTGQVGGRAATETMLQKGTLNDGREIAYGFALSHRTYKGLRTIAHGGADAGFRSYLVRFPDQDLSIALVSNFAQVSSAGLSNQVADIFLEDAITEAKSAGPPVHPFPSIHIPEEVLASYKSTYLNKEGNFVYKLLQSDGVLKIALGTDLPISLSPISGNQFRATDSPKRLLLEIDVDRKQKVEAIHVTTADAVRCTLKPIERPRRSADDLEPLVGRYFNAEIDAFCDVTYDGKRLRMESRKQGPSPLQPTFLDGFNWESGTIRFVRDGRGKPSGFRQNSGRILNLWFEKQDD